MPKSVVKKIQAELPSYKGSGMSIMEISHRSSLYVDMQNEAESDLRQLMNVPQMMAFFVQLDYWLKRYNIRIV